MRSSRFLHALLGALPYHRGPSTRSFLRAVGFSSAALCAYVASDHLSSSSRPSLLRPAARSESFPASAASQSGPDLATVVEETFPSVCRLEASTVSIGFGGAPRNIGVGSGFVISEEGLIVTNDHVMSGMRLAGATEIRAVFDDGRSFIVEPICADAESDIALARLVAPRGTTFRALSPSTTTSAPPSSSAASFSSFFSPSSVGSAASRALALSPSSSSSSSSSASPTTLSAGFPRRGDTVIVFGAPLGGSIVPSVGILAGARYVADDEIMSSVLSNRGDWCLLQVDAAMSSGSSGGPVVDATTGALIGIAVLVQTSMPGQVGHANFAVSMDQAWPIIQSLRRHGRVERPAVGLTVLQVDRLADEREFRQTGLRLLPSAEGGWGGSEASRKRSSGDSGSSNSSGSISLSSSSPSSRAAPHSGLLVTYAVPGQPAAQAGLQVGDVLLEVGGKRLIRRGDLYNEIGPVYEPGRVLDCVVFRPSGGKGDGEGGGEGKIFSVRIKPTKRDIILSSSNRKYRAGTVR